MKVKNSDFLFRDKYKQLDSYSLLKIDELVNTIANYKVYTIDLRSVYHQIPLSEKDHPVTVFEADGNLWQFTRMSFRVTNSSAYFQCITDDMVSKYKL